MGEKQATGNPLYEAIETAVGNRLLRMDVSLREKIGKVESDLEERMDKFETMLHEDFRDLREKAVKWEQFEKETKRMIREALEDLPSMVQKSILLLLASPPKGVKAPNGRGDMTKPEAARLDPAKPRKGSKPYRNPKCTHRGRCSEKCRTNPR